MKQIVFVGKHDLSDAPFAAFFFEQLLREQGLSQCCLVTSRSGRSGYTGSPVNPSVRQALSALGIDCADKRSEPLTKEDFSDALLVCTSAEAMRAVFFHFPEASAPIHLLTSYLAFSEGAQASFENPQFNTIASACRGLLFRLLRQGFFDTIHKEENHDAAC